jgi:hypothetical protein
MNFVAQSPTAIFLLASVFKRAIPRALDLPIEFRSP